MPRQPNPLQASARRQAKLTSSEMASLRRYIAAHGLKKTTALLHIGEATLHALRANSGVAEETAKRVREALKAFNVDRAKEGA